MCGAKDLDRFCNIVVAKFVVIECGVYTGLKGVMMLRQDKQDLQKQRREDV
ncbi:MAG: hypothetical protein FWD76_03930 [Firmicutes bacterium]|nr:hypothetical protein [Bacillota bacterium]